MVVLVRCLWLLVVVAKDVAFRAKTQSGNLREGVNGLTGAAGFSSRAGKRLQLLQHVKARKKERISAQLRPDGLALAGLKEDTTDTCQDQGQK